MTKQRLSLFGIIAISVIVGISMTYAYAAGKPITVTEDCMDFQGRPLCETEYSQICGTERVSGIEAITVETTTWDDNTKYKITETRKGDLFIFGTTNLIATIDDTHTKQGFYNENGATLVKMSHKIHCINGETSVIEHDVNVINHGKKP